MWARRRIIDLICVETVNNLCWFRVCYAYYIWEYLSATSSKHKLSPIVSCVHTNAVKSIEINYVTPIWTAIGVLVSPKKKHKIYILAEFCFSHVSEDVEESWVQSFCLFALFFRLKRQRIFITKKLGLVRAMLFYFGFGQWAMIIQCFIFRLLRQCDAVWFVLNAGFSFGLLRFFRFLVVKMELQLTSLSTMFCRY